MFALQVGTVAAFLAAIAVTIWQDVAGIDATTAVVLRDTGALFTITPWVFSTLDILLILFSCVFPIILYTQKQDDTITKNYDWIVCMLLVQALVQVVWPFFVQDKSSPSSVYFLAASVVALRVALLLIARILYLRPQTPMDSSSWKSLVAVFVLDTNAAWSLYVALSVIASAISIKNGMDVGQNTNVFFWLLVVVFFAELAVVMLTAVSGFSWVWVFVLIALQVSYGWNDPVRIKFVLVFLLASTVIMAVAAVLTLFAVVNTNTLDDVRAVGESHSGLHTSQTTPILNASQHRHHSARLGKSVARSARKIGSSFHSFKSH